MPEFAVYRFVTPTSRGPIATPTFRPVKGAECVGAILAPEGSSLYHPPAGLPPKLKVPKPGREGEFFLFCVFDAVLAAERGQHGLSLVRTGRLEATHGT